MTNTIPEPRANRNGDPCPPWCVQDHNELLIAGKPEFGYMNGHVSDPVTGQLGLRAEVRVRRSGLAGEPAAVDVTRYTLPVLSLHHEKATALAALLESLSTRWDLEQLVDELRQAAVIARDDAAGRPAAVTADEHPGALEQSAALTPWVRSADGARWTAFLADGRMAVIERLDDGDEQGHGASFLPRISAFGKSEQEAAGPVCASMPAAAAWCSEFTAAAE